MKEEVKLPLVNKMSTAGSVAVFVLSCNCVYGISTILTGSNEVAFKGRSFTLICEVLSGDLDAIVFMNDDQIIASVSYTNGECKHRETGYICVPGTCSCNGTTRYTWTVLSVLGSWHNTTLNCDSIYGGVRSNIYTLYVSVAVTEARIVPNVSTLSQIAGTLFRFTCYSQPASRPNAIIRWYRDDENGNKHEITEGITDQTYPNSDGQNVVYVSNSTLFYSPNKHQNGYAVYCTATTAYTASVMSTKVLLNVLFQPDSSLMISSIPEEPLFQVNSTVQLKCRLDGGNPIANLTWSCENLNISNKAIDNSTNSSAILVLTLYITSDMDNEQCLCEGSHYVDNFKTSQSVLLRFFKTNTDTTIMSTLSNTSSGGNINTEATTTKHSIGTDDKYAAILGGIIGGVVAIVIVVGLCIYIRRKGRPDLHRNVTKEIKATDQESFKETEETSTGRPFQNKIPYGIHIGHNGDKITEEREEGTYEELRASKMDFLDGNDTPVKTVFTGNYTDNQDQENTSDIDTQSIYLQPVSQKTVDKTEESMKV